MRTITGTIPGYINEVSLKNGLFFFLFFYCELKIFYFFRNISSTNMYGYYPKLQIQRYLRFSIKSMRFHTFQFGTIVAFFINNKQKEKIKLIFQQSSKNFFHFTLLPECSAGQPGLIEESNFLFQFNIIYFVIFSFSCKIISQNLFQYLHGQQL